MNLAQAGLPHDHLDDVLAVEPPGVSQEALVASVVVFGAVVEGIVELAPTPR